MTISINKKNIPLAIIAGAVVISIFIIGQVSAQTDLPSPDTASISFPVAELGNCAGKAECKSYCDQPNNMEACISFAEKNNLMPKEEIATAKKFLAAGGKGPGGCTGKNSCEAYCNDINNIDACIAFAEQSGIMPPKDLDEAKKVQAAIRRGVKPPACGGKRACDAYCDDPNHIEECVAFASEAGFMSPEEQANAQKMVQAIKSGVKPLPCKGKGECDAFCGQDEHMDECVAFAEAAGFMSKDEAAMAKKTRGKGPGGCKGKEQCDTFCSNPDNEETCFNFGKENGLIPPEQLREMEEGNQRFRDSLSNAPPEVASCLSDALGADDIEKLRSGAMRPSRGLGDKMAECFRKGEEQRFQKDGQNRGPNGGPEGSVQWQSGNDERGNFERRGPPSEDQNQMMPTNGGQFPPNGPGDFDEQRPGDFQGGRHPYDQNYQPQSGAGGYSCQGDNCPSPPTGSQLQQIQRGEIQPMQQYNAPGTGYPPQGDAGGGSQIQGAPSAPPPPTSSGSGGGVAPVESTAPAPAQEPALAPGPTGSISANSMVASVINFFLSPLLIQRH